MSTRAEDRPGRSHVPPTPQGQVAAMMMQAAHEREQNEGQALGQEASDAAG